MSASSRKRKGSTKAKAATASTHSEAASTVVDEDANKKQKTSSLVHPIIHSTNANPASDASSSLVSRVASISDSDADLDAQYRAWLADYPTLKFIPAQDTRRRDTRKRLFAAAEPQERVLALLQSCDGGSGLSYCTEEQRHSLERRRGPLLQALAFRLSGLQLRTNNIIARFYDNQLYEFIPALLVPIQTGFTTPSRALLFSPLGKVTFGAGIPSPSTWPALMALFAYGLDPTCMPRWESLSPVGRARLHQRGQLPGCYGEFAAFLELLLREWGKHSQRMDTLLREWLTKDGDDVELALSGLIGSYLDLELVTR